jgi:hypothetical protein
MRRATPATERDMATEQQRLTEEFLDLAAQLEGLHHLKPKNVLDPARLKRWQKQHGKEADKVLAHRTVLAQKPAIVSTDDLKQWIDKARKAVTAI